MTNQNVTYRVRNLLHLLTIPTDSVYIYRGENKADYPDVSSNLYREYQNSTTIDYISIRDIEALELEAAAKHSNGNPDDETFRSLVQHYHGKTNAIDFTTDVNIALFFACDGHFDKAGRVIRLDRTSTVCDISTPTEPEHRIIAQKSVFVTPPDGYLPANEYEHSVVEVPAELKLPILDHLRRYHGISSKTVYNDLHGFVHYSTNHKTTLEMNFTAMNLDASGEPERAIELLNESIARDPEVSITHMLKGIIKQGAGDILGAIDSLNTAIEINPQNVNAYNHRGICHQIRGHRHWALADYDQALKINPHSVTTLNNRAVLHHENDNITRALRDCDRALRIDPNFGLALNNRGICHLKANKPDLAIPDFTEAIDQQPNWALPYLNRGLAYIAMEDVERAQADIRHAVALDPDLEEYIRNDQAFVEIHTLVNAP